LISWFADVKPAVVCPGLSSICRFFKFFTFTSNTVEKVTYILLSVSHDSPKFLSI
jgi:hypothetical protein